MGCAGGIDATFTFKYKKKDIKKGQAFKIAVKGLKGGHSGMDIILGRGNSNKIMFRLLKMAAKKYRAKLVDIDGGSLRNAIPREAFATVVVPQKKTQAFLKAVKKFEAIVQSELQTADPDVVILTEETDLPAYVIDAKTQRKLIDAVYGCPNGVIRMSNDMENLVETSTNLAIVKSGKNKIEVKALLRSSVESAKEDLAEMMTSIFTLAGAKCKFDGAYPGWKPNPKSEILDTMQKIYKDKWGKIPEIKAIHAGLECGLLGAVYPNWDMISFGPTIRSPHSPDEKVNIATVAKFWDYLVASLANTPKK
ncbi:MAG: hypothetical protein CSB03_00880 [Bacteroidia bacterium]|nr:MAG: hypothetical protein CSB03_00880 [Bacteroidia bacterium]